MRGGKLTVFLACLGLAGCAGLGVELIRVRVISPERAEALLRAAPASTIIDVSPWSDYRDAHLLGAISIPYLELFSRISELPADVNEPILVYDAGGKLSRVAAIQLRDRGGYNHVYELRGGLRAWAGARLPFYQRRPPVFPEPPAV